MKTEWIAAAGRLIDRIETPEFGASLAAALRIVAPFDFAVMFGYVGAARPLALYDDFPSARHRLHVEDYLEGPYLLDPFFLASTDLSDPGLWRLSELAPDRFYQGEYYRSYYAQTGLAEEIGYLIGIDDLVTVVVSMMRTERRFSTGEVRALKAFWPVVEAACRRHWAGIAPAEDRPTAAPEDSVERALRTIGQGILTPRERQIVEHTLRGHSAEAVGRILGIASGTVRIHRRNIYAKLHISSQGELFSRFLDAILHPGGSAAARRAEETT